MRYQILGPLEVEDGSRPVTLPQGRQRLLLAVLLANANQVVSRDRLIDALWEDAPPPTAAGSLHNLVSGVRRVVGDALVTRDGGYVLHVVPGECDAERFAALAERGSAALAAGDAGRADATLREALALWRGPPLGDLAGNRALADEAARLDEARLVALEDRIDADLLLGRHHESLVELQALTAQHPLRERLHGQQMLALYRSGRQAEALTAYRDTRERLVGELGIEPGPALRRLERAVLAQDPELGASDTLPRAPPRVAWAKRHGDAFVAAGAAIFVVAVVLVVLLGSQGDRAPPSSRAVQAAPGAVVAIDPGTGKVIERTPVGATPSAVAVGAGAVWTVNADENTVSRVDLRTNAVRTQPADAIPLDIAAGEEAAWLITGGSNLRSVPPPARIDRLDAASGAPIASQPLTPRAGMPTRAPPQLVAAGAGGVWAIGRTGRLHRIDPVSGDVDAVRGLSAVRVAAGDDQIWVLIEPPPRRPRAENLVRLDPRDGRIAAGVRVPGRSLGALAVGAGGVWLTDSFNGAVWRVDPTLRSLPRQIPVDPGVDAIAASDEGVWTANSVTGTVARIDTTRNAVSDKIDLGGAPRGIAIGAGRVWVTNVPASSAPGAATSLRSGSSVEPVASRDCGPVLAGPSGDPDVLIVFDDLFVGTFRSRVEATNAAVAHTLRAHAFRAGPLRVGLQACSDGLAQSGSFDEGKCRVNARAYARNPAVRGVVGPSHSACTAAMLPILNRAPGGAVPIISHANTGAFLVGRDPLAPAGELDRLFPEGRRGYARIMPADDYEVAAAAMHAQRMSPEGVFVVTDEFTHEGPAPVWFRHAAGRLGLPILGSALQRSGSRRVATLARRIVASGAGAVYLQTGADRFIAPLRARLGEKVTIILAAFGGIPISGLFDVAGAAARGIHVMSPGLPVDRLPPAGRRFVRDFGSRRPGGRVPEWAVYGAAATEALLAAIARSDGSRPSVAGALESVDLPDTPVGRLRFTRTGEPMTNPVAIVRAERGGEPDDGVSTAGGTVIDIVDPPSRLVGADGENGRRSAESGRGDEVTHRRVREG